MNLEERELEKIVGEGAVARESGEIRRQPGCDTSIQLYERTFIPITVSGHELRFLGGHRMVFLGIRRWAQGVTVGGSDCTLR